MAHRSVTLGMRGFALLLALPAILAAHPHHKETWGLPTDVYHWLTEPDHLALLILAVGGLGTWWFLRRAARRERVQTVRANDR